MTDWQSRFAARGAALRPSAIRRSAAFATEPGVISFASGSPDPDLFPHEAVTRLATEILADAGRRAQALQYAGSEGYGPLRELIAAQAARDGAAIEPADVVITNGSQQALELVGKLFIEPGDRIIVTDPTYLGALQAFNLFEPAYAGVALDETGIDLAALERELVRGAKFMYLMPDFGNPSGVTVPLEGRRQVLALARQYGVPIFEDQAYQHLWFGDARLPTMLALDAEDGRPGAVIHAGTFSKSLAPGLRIGWIAAPRPVVEKLVLVKQASDLQAPLFNQMLVHALASTILDEQVVGLRLAYRRRRDAMLRALARHMPQNVSWNEPDGGMFVWLTLPAPLDALEVQTRAVHDHKVVFVPGAPFFANGGDTRTARLSFATAPEPLIGEGIARLAAAIRASEAALGR